MLLSQVDITLRVARRYRQSQARTQDDPHDHALVWTIPAPFPSIPDDIVVQCSDGCTVTTKDVESAINKTKPIMRQSCRFSEVHANDGVNRVRFRVRNINGQLLRGTVTVNIVAREDQLTAYSPIELDQDLHPRINLLRVTTS